MTAALVRMAGLPLSMWLAGGSPELFERIRVEDERTRARQHHARRLAAEIGVRLVAHPALDGPARARVLRVRRRLHNGSAVPSPELADLADLAERALPGHELAVDLRDLIALDGALEASRRTVEDAIGAEERRLLAEPWRLLHASPVGRNAARVGDLAVYGDIQRRVAAGEPWTSKRMRTRSDYLWRMITRGAARATPRGWLAHVALLEVVGDGGLNGSEVLRVRDSAASEEAEKLDRLRTEQVSAEALR